MKTLTKIKLINWHGFYDETIEVSGGILITGENGSGKSTILDAIYFLLSGGDTNIFNAAANENATRTVETYMKGKIGFEGREFLRNDANIVSHIALEFKDTETNKYFVLGVVLEIQEGKNKVGRSFYHIKDRKLKEEDYFLVRDNQRKIYCNFKAMKKSLGDTINELSGSRVDVRSALYAVLSLENKKYYELLPKAIAFKPIPDVNSFVYQFLMPQNDVEISSIKEIIHTYNEIQKRIAEDVNKQEMLQQITVNGESYLDKVNEKKLIDAYRVKRDIDLATSSIDALSRQIEGNDVLIKQNEQKKNDTEKDLERTKESIYSIEHNEAYIALRDLEKDFATLERDLKSAEGKESEFNQKILSEDALLSKLGIKGGLSKFIKSKSFAEFRQALSDSHEAYELERNKLSSKISDGERDEREAQGEIKRLNADLDKLNKGNPVYPEAVNALIEVIKKCVYEHTRQEIAVRPFCELIDIKEGEEEWRNAAEGYLNTRRFDLFVAPAYYDLALRLYEKYKYERKITGVGLVNTAKIKSEEPQAGSLATKLVSDDEDAKKYIAYLLGRVICVDSEDDLKNYEASITKTVMVYQNKAARQTKFEVYRTPFIGAGSRKIRISQIKEKLKVWDEKLKAIQSELSKLQGLRRATSDSSYSFLFNHENIWERVDGLKTKKSSTEEQLSELRVSSNQLVINKQSFEVEKKRLEGLLKSIEEEHQELTYQYRLRTDNLKAQKESLVGLTPQYEAMLLDDHVKANIITYMAEHPMSKEKLNVAFVAITKSIDSLKTTIEKAMYRYIVATGFDATSDIESLEAFFNEYNAVVKRDLEKYQSQLEKVKADAVSTFQNEYISKIQRYIRKERENIKKLNDVLVDKPFGFDREIYRFEITRSKDSRFGDYYDIFMSNENYQNNNIDLFTEQLSDKHLKLMQELFMRLTDEGRTDAQQERLIQEYTDYRKFMNYDIIITNKDGEETRFSKINKEKSGGETQTPFYVIIAASFDQIIHNSYGQRSPGCIVMFDEAFNNMDESRIDSMMKYFQKLDIQPIIAVPTQRAKTIMPFIETTIGLVKIKNRIVPRRYIKEA